MAGKAKAVSIQDYDCLGPSMLPTLKAGDALQVVPYNETRISPGDVIVFCPPQGGHHVVHRVMTVGTRGVRTRGDSNRCPDPWVLCADDVLGRVVSVRKGNRWVRVHGGLWGAAWARALAMLRTFDRMASRALHPAYRWLARAGVFKVALPHNWRPQVLSFERPGGAEKLLVLGRRVIGRRPLGAGQWQIRRPFRLLVDETSLPEGIVVTEGRQESPCQH